MIEKLNIDGVDVPIGAQSTNVKHGNGNVSDALGSLNTRVTTIEGGTTLTISGGRNVYNKSTMLYANSDVNTNANFGTLGALLINHSMTQGRYAAKIPVKAGKPYVITNNDHWSTMAHFSFLDSENNPISVDGKLVNEWMWLGMRTANEGVLGYYGPDKIIDDKHRRITMPEGCMYFALSVYIADNPNTNTRGINIKDTLMIEEGNWPSTYEDGGGEYITHIGGKPIRCIDNDRIATYDVPLNMYVLGDSIATLTPSYGLFAKYLVEKFSFKYTYNLAMGGAHWSILKDRVESESSGNDIVRQVRQLKSMVDNQGYPTPQLILIHAGQNDFSPFALAQTVFTMTSADTVFNYANADYQDWSSWMLTDVADATSEKYRTNSVAGGMRITIETIRSYWPYCKIVITIPLQVAAYGGNTGWNQDGYFWQIVDNMKKAAQRLSVPYIDLACEGGISKTNQSLFKSDGVHLSGAGGLRVADIIGRYLVSHYGFKNWSN